MDTTPYTLQIINSPESLILAAILFATALTFLHWFICTCVTQMGHYRRLKRMAKEFDETYTRKQYHQQCKKYSPQYKEFTTEEN